MSGERKAWPTGLCQAEPPRRSYSAIRRDPLDVLAYS